MLRLIVSTFAPTGEIVVGIDETLERRRGKSIKAKGIYRDAVRSSKSFFVKSTGLRWCCMMLLVPISWARRLWALPFLSVLSPSESYFVNLKRRHKKVTKWATQMAIQLRRWLPDQRIVLVGDSGYSTFALLDHCNRMKPPIVVVTRLRLDAALYTPAPERQPGQKGRPRLVGGRLPVLKEVVKNPETAWQPIVVPLWYSQTNRPVEIVSEACIWYRRGEPPVPIRYVLVRDPEGKFETQALLCTELVADPVQVISYFVKRWQVEETFQEARTHLGMETQRQWNDLIHTLVNLAILRTTPTLLGLFSVVTLIAHRLESVGKLTVSDDAWYHKNHVTFSDAIAAVRREIWQTRLFGLSLSNTEMTKVGGWIQTVLEAMQETLCYAT